MGWGTFPVGQEPCAPDKKEQQKIFSVALEEESHLFPFRTQKLSPSSSMVLLSRGSGRVERRRVLNMKKHQWMTKFAGVFL